MQDSRNKNNRNSNREQDDASKHNSQKNVSTRDLGADESLQKDTRENDRLRTAEPDNYERDSE